MVTDTQNSDLWTSRAASSQHKAKLFFFLGGILFGFVGGITARQGREPILILGFVTAAVAYFLMLLNLPAASAIRETLPGETGLMTPSSIIVLVTGFGLGFSDACFMTQVSQT